MSKIFSNYLLYVFISLIFLILLIVIKREQLFPNQKSQFKQNVDYYIEESYNGIVENKFIDNNEHNYHKVFIRQTRGLKTITLDSEVGGFFEFIKKGDSLIKKQGELDVNVIRGIDLDTIITLKLYKGK